MKRHYNFFPERDISNNVYNQKKIYPKGDIFKNRYIQKMIYPKKDISKKYISKMEISFLDKFSFKISFFGTDISWLYPILF